MNGNSFSHWGNGTFNTNLPGTNISSPGNAGNFLDWRPGNTNQPGNTGLNIGGSTPTQINPWTAGINAFSGLANTYLGFENLDLSNEQFDQAQAEYGTNLFNQAQTINSQMGNQWRNNQLAQGNQVTQADVDAYIAGAGVSGTILPA